MNRTHFQKICIFSITFLLIGTIFIAGIRSNEKNIETDFTVTFSKPNINYINNKISITFPEIEAFPSTPSTFKPLATSEIVP